MNIIQDEHYLRNEISKIERANTLDAKPRQDLVWDDGKHKPINRLEILKKKLAKLQQFKANVLLIVAELLNDN